MSSVLDKYEVIVGLEVHAQLSTQSKMYCGDSAAYGAAPNTQVSPLSLGHPGTLPKVNKKAIEYAVKIGLATHCSIRRENQFARKNYFYADLPKGYQITQDKTPICYDGYIEFESGGEKKKVELERIHMEEDAGKSTHDLDPYFTLVDLNRAGVPLIEIVSRPDIPVVRRHISSSRRCANSSAISTSATAIWRKAPCVAMPIYPYVSKATQTSIHASKSRT
jgi:aspartyl-tRNA(Asn)/glutamyl-tRNA(Gln) amidotransferase subunit B